MNSKKQKQDVWMPLYIADYLRDTTHLRAAESGAYLHLIMAYWVAGKLPDDDRQLATIAKLSLREFKKMRASLAHFFGPGWSHKRIDQELALARENAEKASKKGKSGADARWHGHAPGNATGNATGNAQAMPTGMPADAPSPSPISKKDKTAQSAASAVPKEAAGKYAFEGVVIKLTPEHFRKWSDAFLHLDLRAELVARDAWLASDRATPEDRKNWFISTSKYLANRNGEAKAKVVALRPEQREVAAVNDPAWRHAHRNDGII